jgi:hypothetical protein
MRRVVLLALFLLSLPVAAESMRCGSKLVTDGDTMDKVRQLCGEPSAISRTEIMRIPQVWIGGRPYAVSNEAVAVPVETWTYNFGKYKLMRRVRFEDGVLTKIETLEHGY